MVTPKQTQGWEPLWSDLDALSDYWRTPEQTVALWAERLWDAGGRRVLDLGCGIGRHTIALARQGFSTVASDAAFSGLAICAAWLAREGLRATTVRHGMETLAFPNNLFDGLVSYNVIYHTTVAGMQRVMSGIRRVLRPDGWLYITIISCKDSKVAGYRPDIEAGKCQEIEPFTFVYPRDAPDDKYLPHHYSNEAQVRDFLTGFTIDDLCVVRVEYPNKDGVIETGVHYHVQARRT
ncbi:MAG: class I SAM-dependent methyltransferase [Chloroflexi bacterium]|nr:class I SAM-dependent methyltransferase [Chloroflexota bacterium]